MRRTPEEVGKEMTAYHEAGHAVVAMHFRWQVTVVTTSPPQCDFMIPELKSRQNACGEYQVLQGAYLALWLHERKHRHDVCVLSAFMRLAGSEEEISDSHKMRVLSKDWSINAEEQLRLEKKTCVILRQKWYKVECIAQQLLRTGIWWGARKHT